MQKSPFGELCNCVRKKWGHANLHPQIQIPNIFSAFKSKISAPVICNYFVWMINEKKMSKGTIHTLLQTINLDNKLLSHHLMLYDFTNSVLAFPIFLNWNTILRCRWWQNFFVTFCTRFWLIVCDKMLPRPLLKMRHEICRVK